MPGQSVLFAVFLLPGVIGLRAQTAPPTIVAGGVPVEVVEIQKQKPEAFMVGLTLTSDFDDNALNDNRHKQYNALTIFAPHVGWSLLKSRYEWKLDYEQGVSVSRPVTAYKARSYSLGTSFKFRMSKRLVLRARESFLESDNPFDRLLASQFGSVGPLVDRPNSSILTPARTSSEQAEFDITYGLSSHSTISAIGSFYNVSRSATVGTERLSSATSASGHLVYSNHTAQRHWIGLDYGVQTLVSRDPASKGLVQTFYCTNTLVLTPNSVVSVAAGPERTFVDDQSLLPISLGAGIGRRSTWSWAGTATYFWTAGHTNFVSSFSRRISNGEGLLGIVHLSNISTQFQSRLANGWHANLLASYDDERTLSLAPSRLSYISMAAGLKRTLSPGLSLQVIYWRIHELSEESGLGALRADHNRISASVTYNFNDIIRK